MAQLGSIFTILVILWAIIAQGECSHFSESKGTEHSITKRAPADKIEAIVKFATDIAIIHLGIHDFVRPQDILKLMEGYVGVPSVNGGLFNWVALLLLRPLTALRSFIDRLLTPGLFPAKAVNRFTLSKVTGWPKPGRKLDIIENDSPTGVLFRNWGTRNTGLIVNKLAANAKIFKRTFRDFKMIFKK